MFWSSDLYHFTSTFLIPSGLHAGEMTLLPSFLAFTPSNKVPNELTRRLADNPIENPHSLSLPQTLEYSHAPQASATGNIPDMAVLFKLFGMDIIARSKTAT